MLFGGVGDTALTNTIRYRAKSLSPHSRGPSLSACQIKTSNLSTQRNYTNFVDLLSGPIRGLFPITYDKMVQINSCDFELAKRLFDFYFIKADNEELKAISFSFCARGDLWSTKYMRYIKFRCMQACR